MPRFWTGATGAAVFDRRLHEDFVPMVEAVKRTGRHVIHASIELPKNEGYGYFLRNASDDHIVITKADLARLS
ncbi:MAG: hypothetical protein V2A79_17695 [Planctomycetota bacterium]